MRRKPTHPGRLLKNMLELYQTPLLAVISFDARVGAYEWVDLINEKQGITELMADVLAKGFDMYPEAWLNAQRNYDKWMEENNE